MESTSRPHEAIFRYDKHPILTILVSLVLSRMIVARERVRDFELFDTYSEKVIDIFRTRALADESIDVQDVFGRFTMDAAGQFLFGTNTLNTLELPLPRPGQGALGSKGTQLGGDYGKFVSAFEGVQQVVGVRFRRSWLWPLMEMITDATDAYNGTIDDWVIIS